MGGYARLRLTLKAMHLWRVTCRGRASQTASREKTLTAHCIQALSGGETKVRRQDNPCLNQAGILVSIARCSKIKFITCSLTISIIRSIGSITVAFIRERMHDYDEAFKTEFREECESKDPKTQEEYQDKAFQDQRRFEFYKEQVTKSHVVPWSHLMLDASQAYILWTDSPRSKNPATKARFVQMAEKTEINVAMETEWTRSYLYFLWQIHRAGAKHIVWYAHINKQFVCGPLYQAFEDIAPSKAAG